MSNHASEINYSEEQDIRQNLCHLTAAQGICLDSAFSPHKRNNLRYHQTYFDNAGFILSAAPSFMLKFGRCGIPNSTNPSGRCKKRHYCNWCSRCSYLPYRSKFNDSFHAGQYSFATFSWVGNIPWTAGVVASCLKHWDAINTALKGLRSESLVNGYLASEEMFVRSFMPLQVLPHTHCILEGVADAEEVIRMATESITTNLNGHDEALVPNIQIAAIENDDSFQGHLEYMFKPLKLKDAYELAWFENCAGDDRTHARPLNSEVKDFVLGFNEMTKGRMMVKTSGTMNGNSAGYVGTRRRARRQRRRQRR